MGQSCVIDANITLGLFLRLPYSERIDQRIQIWQAEEEHLVVPTLWEYECISGLRRAVTLKLITSQEMTGMIEDLFSLEIERIPPSMTLHRSAIHWAERIGQSKVYDAQYLALAEILSAEFWTADQHLYHATQVLGVNWIHII